MPFTRQSGIVGLSWSACSRRNQRHTPHPARRLGGGWRERATGALCAASTHASTDVRPIARCLRYGRPAPINSDAIPATKRPNAIHLGCMVNLVGRPPSPSYCATTAGAGRAMSVPPTDGLIADRGTRPEHCRGRCPRPAGFCRLRIGEPRSGFQTRRGKRR